MAYLAGEYKEKKIKSIKGIHKTKRLREILS
jgi:hypothetical protein